jgi:hypothetical protein
MAVTRYLLIIMRAVLVVCWASCAAAASIALAHPGVPLDPVLVVICGAISTLSGATTLAIRVNTLIMESPEKPLVRPWFFVIAHMLGSWLAGVMAFLGTRINGNGDDTAMLAVLLMSFGGAKVIEKAAEIYLPKVLPTQPPNPPGGAA